MVHRKVGVPLADLLTTPKSLSVTGFFFEVDKFHKDNAALAPLTNALEQIMVSGSQIDFSTVNFSVNLVWLDTGLVTSSLIAAG